ncbi:MAG TPA: glycosyltransferase [Candidatus Methylacidiphilales bacterium]|nr:glycosyltransferase [Candidatus Methylacidiphilales bacterium]
MANEEQDFADFIRVFTEVLDFTGSGHVYFVVDNVSKDRTLDLCRELSTRDNRFHTIWAPENRYLVDAYLRGLREAVNNGHNYIIEMDAGLSHDPRAIPMFLRVLTEGNECAFGSRYINGGSMADSPPYRRFLSKAGTVAAHLLLGARLADMTSGFQGFSREVLSRLLAYPLRSKAHFYQTEVRHLLRNARLIEVPIHYRAPSPRVSPNAIRDSIKVLLHYFKLRLLGQSPSV